MKRHDLLSILLLILAAVLVFFFSQDQSEEAEPIEEMVFTVAYESATASNLAIRFITEEEGLQYAKVEQQRVGAHCISFVFPFEETIDSLSISMNGPGDIGLQSVYLQAGNQYKKWGVKDLTTICSEGKVSEASFLIDCSGQPIQLGQVSLAPSIENQNPSVTPWLILSGIVVALLLYFSAKNRRFEQVFVALIFAFLCGWLSQLLQGDLQGMQLELTYTDKGPSQENCQLYYSESGTFDSEAYVEKPMRVMRRKSKLQIDLPAHAYNGLRFDLPTHQEWIIHELNIHVWPFGEIYSGRGEQILQLPKNDIRHTLDESSSIEFHTGELDPYLLFQADKLQSAKQWILIKERYPFFIGLMGLFIALYVFRGKLGFAAHSYVLTFILILLLPGLTWLFQEDQKVFVNEKKVPAPQPEEWLNLKESTNELKNYVNDHFGGRDHLITANNAFKLGIYRQTAKSSPAFVGKHDWLFYRANGVEDLALNRTTFSPEELDTICNRLERRRKWLALYGIEYYLFFPEMKHSFYEENLPERFDRHRKVKTRLELLEEAIRSRTKLKLIDLKPKMYEAKAREEKELYYLRDSHWNLLGAFYAYQEVMEELSLDYSIGPIMTRDDFRWHDTISYEGDLPQLLSLTNILSRSEIVPNPKEEYKAEAVTSLDYPDHESPFDVITMEQENTNLPRMMMHRDSYTNFLIPFFSEHFSRSVYLWTPRFDAEAIKQERPDIFMTEIMERFVHELLLPEPEIIGRELEAAEGWESSVSNAEVVRSEG